jgi:hypothetical protein
LLQIEVNVLGTKNVLEACKKQGLNELLLMTWGATGVLLAKGLIMFSFKGRTCDHFGCMD